MQDAGLNVYIETVPWCLVLTPGGFQGGSDPVTWKLASFDYSSFRGLPDGLLGTRKRQWV